MDKKPIAIYYRENLWQSVIADLASFGIMTGAFAVNAYFIKSRLLAGFILLACLLWMLAKANNKKVTFYDKETLLEHIEKTVE